MANSRFKIPEIQTGLGLSVHCFAQLREEVRREVEDKGLTTTTLATSGMGRNMHNIVDTLISKFKKRITLIDDEFVRDAVSC